MLLCQYVANKKDIWELIEQDLIIKFELHCNFVEILKQTGLTLYHLYLHYKLLRHNERWLYNHILSLSN